MPYYVNAYDVIPLPNVTSTTTYDVINGTDLSIDDVLHLTIRPVIIVGRYVHFLWYAIGFIGNVISAIMWLKPKMYEVCSSAHYLFSIAICDIICQLMHVFFYLKFFWRVKAFDSITLCEFWGLVYMVPQYVGKLLVIAYTIDKLISVNSPFSTDRYFSNKRGVNIIVWIVISVTAMVFPQAYFWKGYCADHRTSGFGYAIYNWLMLIIVYIATPILTLILNFRIIYVYRNPDVSFLVNQNQKDFALKIYEKIKSSTQESVYILVSLSFFRVISLLPKTLMQSLHNLEAVEPTKLPVVYTLEDVENSERWHRYIVFSAVELSFGMIGASYLALSIVVYLITSRHFRFMLRHKILLTTRQLMYWLRKQIDPCFTFIRSINLDDECNVQ